ncbi:MAG: enoyl-CoA hydratase-related protein [Myxococcota bacterium]
MTDEAQTDTIRTEIDDEGICTVTLHRPKALNAMNGELVDFLWHTFYELSYEPRARVIVLTGSGAKAFCVGADLKERAGMSEAAVAKRIDEYGKCFGAIEHVSKPVICAINGYAFGGGLEMALACDLRVMAEDTRVGLTELKLGIIPGAGGTQRLPRLIGPSRAKELIFTGARIDAPRALELGLVDRVAPKGQVVGVAKELARAMLDSAPLALAQAKIAINQGIQADLGTGIQLESRCYATLLDTQDRVEGLNAFKEGRKPEFKGT